MLVTTGCASPQVTFTTSEKATISLVALERPTDQGEVVGDSPQTIDVSRLEGKVVKIGGADVVPQYWVMRKLEGDTTKISLKIDRISALPDRDKNKDKEKDKDKDKDPNGKPDDKKGADGASDKLKYRLLMKAYTALFGHEFAMARGFAEQLAKLDVRAPAPLVVVGLTYMQEGNRDAARSAFEKARALDPEDQDISKLIDAVR